MQRLYARMVGTGKIWIVLVAVLLGTCCALAGAGQAQAAPSAAGTRLAPLTAPRRSLATQRMSAPKAKPIQATQTPNGCITGVSIGPFPVQMCGLSAETMNAQLQAGLPLLSTTDAKWTYGSPDISALRAYMLVAVDLFLVLVVLATGIQMIWEQSSFSWVSFRETLPQVLCAFLLAQVSLQLAGAIIGLNNALASFFWVTAQLAYHQLIPATLNLTDLGEILLEASLGFLLIVLILEATIRLAVLNLLLVLSPAGCFALAWKPTQRLGFVWFNTFLATVFVQFFQIVCLAVGFELMKNLYSQQPNAYIRSLGGIAILCVTLAIPFAAYRWAFQPVMTATRATAEGAMTVGRIVGQAVGL